MAQSTAVSIIRSVSGIVPDISVEEQHQDQLVITDHPIEQGATISDHAFKLPAEVIVTYGWVTGSPQNTAQGNSFLNALYDQILAIQSAVSLFTVYTTRRTYQNMLMQGVTQTTDKSSANALIVRMLCREINLVSTQTVTVSTDPTTLSSPQKALPVANQGTQQLKAAPSFNLMSFLGLDK